MEANNDALMAEVRRYWSDNFDYLVGDNPTLSIITNIARHFADWQSERMAKSMPLPEDTVLFQKGVAEGRRLEREDMMKGAVEGFIFQPEDYYPKELIARYNGDLKHGDKVKVIVIPED